MYPKPPNYGSGLFAGFFLAFFELAVIGILITDRAKDSFLALSLLPLSDSGQTSLTPRRGLEKRLGKAKSQKL